MKAMLSPSLRRNPSGLPVRCLAIHVSRGLATVFVVGALILAGARTASAVAVVSTLIDSGDTGTANAFFTVRFQVTSNDTGSTPSACSFRVVYDLSSVSYITALDGDLGTVSVGSEVTTGSLAARDVSTAGSTTNTLLTPTCFLITFQVAASPATPYSILVYDDTTTATPLLAVDSSGIPHVFDTTATEQLCLTPTLTCPAPVNVQCNTDVPAPNPALVSVTDACGTPTVTFVSDVSDGNSCPETITRTYQLTDLSGTYTCTQTITVNDTIAPVITCPGPVSVECPADVPLPNVGLVSATDNCSTVTITWVSDVTDGNSCPETIDHHAHISRGRRLRECADLHPSHHD